MYETLGRELQQLTSERFVSSHGDTDVHSKGIRTLAQLLRDRSVEVIYLGEHNTSESFINAIIAEDVDLVGLSFSSSTYLHYTRDLIEKMKLAGIGDVPIMLGGLIHAYDEPALREIGVKGIFGPGTTIEQVVDFLANLPRQAR
nr:cobalamin-dependent protein [Pseudomonas umsongensis]